MYGCNTGNPLNILVLIFEYLTSKQFKCSIKYVDLMQARDVCIFNSQSDHDLACESYIYSRKISQL